MIGLEMGPSFVTGVAPITSQRTFKFDAEPNRKKSRAP